MILLCGIPSETTLASVAVALERRGHEFTIVNQRLVKELKLDLRHSDAGLTGRLSGPGYDLALADVTGIYVRLMDYRYLPELVGEMNESPALLRAGHFHSGLAEYTDIAPARVANRYSAMGSNFSKPFQSQLIRDHGFDVPETLVTNQPDEVRAFHAAHAPVIYKSISGERSIVSVLDVTDTERLERIRWCPVQFQALVRGGDVRVHTVGEEVFATAIDSDAVDYRYATRQTGVTARFKPYRLGDELAQRCVNLAASLGLEVAGVDLKVTPEGRVVCLEVNPTPVLSYFELRTGQPIADAVARLLTRAGVSRVVNDDVSG